MLIGPMYNNLQLTLLHPKKVVTSIMAVVLKTENISNYKVQFLAVVIRLEKNLSTIRRANVLLLEPLLAGKIKVVTRSQLTKVLHMWIHSIKDRNNYHPKYLNKLTTLLMHHLIRNQLTLTTMEIIRTTLDPKLLEERLMMSSSKDKEDLRATRRIIATTTQRERSKTCYNHILEIFLNTNDQLKLPKKTKPFNNCKISICPVEKQRQPNKQCWLAMIHLLERLPGNITMSLNKVNPKLSIFKFLDCLKTMKPEICRRCPVPSTSSLPSLMKITSVVSVLVLAACKSDLTKVKQLIALSSIS